MPRPRPFRLVLGLSLLGVLAAGCELITEPGEEVRGSGEVVEEERVLRGFSAVELAGIGEVRVRQGPREEVVVEAEDNLLPYLETRVEGGTLVVRTGRGVRLRPTRPVRVHVMLRELDGLVLSGSGSIAAPVVDAGELEVALSGSGEIELDDLLAGALRASITGSGELRASGEVDEQEVTLSGSGRYRAPELESRRADARLLGSGSVVLRVLDRLDVVLSGSGVVRYYGDPTVRQTVTGSGRVERAGG